MDCAAWRSVRKGFLENFKTLVNLLFTFASDGLLVLGYVFFFFFCFRCERSSVQISNESPCSFETTFF